MAEKVQTSVIEDCWNIEVSNIDSYGQNVKLVFTGLNTNGKKVKVKIKCEMYIVREMAKLGKKSVVNFATRVQTMKNDFLKELEDL